MTLFGPDGSHWQFQPKGSVDLVLSADDWDSIAFVLWRSSIGFRTDGTFARMRDATIAHNTAFTAYHWVYPTGRYDARGQAEAMAKANPDKDIPVMLDWETESGLRPTIDDCDAVADAMSALGYRVPLLYTGVWYWSASDIGRPTLTGRGYDLVLSDYNTNPALPPQAAYAKGGGDNAAEWGRNLGGLTPVVWQYGSLVRFGNLNWDHNAFRGQVADLSKYFRTGSAVVDVDPSPPPPQETPIVMRFVEFWEYRHNGALFAVFTNDHGGREKKWMRDRGHLDQFKSELRWDGYTDEQVDADPRNTDDPDKFRALGEVVAPVPDGFDGWGVPET